MVLSIVAAESCRFLLRTEVLTEVPTGGNPTIGAPTENFDGLFRSLDTTSNRCVSQNLVIDSQPILPDEPIMKISTSHKVARAFGIIAPFFGAVSVFLSMFPFFRKSSKVVGLAAAWMCFASMIFQSLTFMLFNMQECKDSTEVDATGTVNVTMQYTVHCKVDEGANHSIAAAVLFLIAGIVLCRLPASSDGPFISFGKEDAPVASSSPDSAQPVQQSYPGIPSGTDVRRQVNPDGSTTTYVTRSMNPVPQYPTPSAATHASHGATTLPQSNVSDAAAQEWVNRAGSPPGQHSDF